MTQISNLIPADSLKKFAAICDKSARICVKGFCIAIAAKLVETAKDSWQPFDADLRRFMGGFTQIFYVLPKN
ncbi:MAG: hypothetical protein EAZ30_08410 [Betaproteobacteria bacterium]|nr:MAG: hypothetical protein EAZ30_08410 [Betaproteobacteria bacterium]